MKLLYKSIGGEVEGVRDGVLGGWRGCLAAACPAGIASSSVGSVRNDVCCDNDWP